MNNESRDTQLEKRIDAYIKGGLGPEEVDELWVQLLKKPEYISMLETEIDVARIYHASEARTPGFAAYWKWVGAAAAVIALVISINIFTGNNKKTIRQWTQSTIDLSQNLATAPVTRSQTVMASADSLLNAGFKAAVDGRIDEAVKIYKTVINHYKSATVLRKAYLNLGILTYNNGHFSESINYFKRALAKSPDESLLKEQAYWYMGNGYANLKKFSLARASVLKAYHIGRIYPSEEFDLLKRLNYKLQHLENQSE